MQRSKVRAAALLTQGGLKEIYKVVLHHQKRIKRKMKVSVKASTTKNTTENSRESAVDLQEKINRRAYELYERRGREAGHENEDWLQAEAELASERTRLLAGEAVKKDRKPPVTSTGKTKAKHVKKPRLPAQSKTKEEARDGD
jgi:hypothetical protein